MNYKFNKQKLRDKILACWIGKNIGGTVGGPFESQTEMLDIPGFTTAKGEPLPNDDLDLQIAWLMTLDRSGARGLDANELAHSWMMFITLHWNEYGIAHKNVKMGLLPPLSGEFDNKLWRNSNGAWIRTEIWACLAPGFPNIAAKYAIMDASVDHGLGEGTIAAIFTAAMESIAFYENDMRLLIETALGYIPSDSMLARSVRLVLEEYDKGTPYRETREKVVELNKELGWFQAPGNVAFAVIGLIYGEGDFKNSIIYAVNCADDTDCTAGTVGAVLGIMNGTSGIPEDWKEYIGDRINQICINPHYLSFVPKTCTEFTDRIIGYITDILRVNKVVADLVDDEDAYDREEAFKVLEGYSEDYYNRSKYSFDITRPAYLTARVEFDKEPIARAGEELTFKVKFQQLHIYGEPIEGYVNITLPEGWTADYRKAVHIAKPRDVMPVSMPYQDYSLTSDLEVTVIPGENIGGVNKLYVNVELNTSPIPFVVPVTIVG